MTPQTPCSHKTRVAMTDGSKPFCPECEPEKDVVDQEKEWWQKKVDESFPKPDGEYVPRDRSLEQLASCHDGTNEIWEAVDEAREQRRINDYFNRIAIHEAVHDLTREIVAEAEQRGRVAAWEEAKEIANDLTPFHITREYRDTDAMRDQLVSVFNAKLTELKKV